MTSPALPPSTAGELREAISSLMSAVEALGLGESRLAEADPLRALILGTGGVGDVTRLDVPIEASRLLVFRCKGSGKRLVDEIGHDRNAHAAEISSGIVAALVRNSPRRADDERARCAATRLIALASRVELQVVVGVSTQLQDETQLPQAFADAVDCAELAARDGSSSRWVDDAWAELTLARLRNRIEDCLPTTHPLASLASKDRPAGRELLRSVAAYLACNQDTQKTATELCLHPNTLRYRLRRAREVGGLDLNDPAHRLVAELVLGR